MIRSEDVYVKSSIRKTAIRIVKKKSDIYGMIEPNFEADFEIKLVKEPDLCYEVPNEFIIYLEHEMQTGVAKVHASFELKKGLEIEAILLEKQYIPFKVDGDNLTFDFDLGGLTGNTGTLNIHTIYEEEPSLRLRLDHNDIGRKSGMYSETYPELQVRAAQHYIMGMREIIRMLDIPAYLAKNELGYMYILGFETNNKIHIDYPPHWHLIYRWATFVGSQAPHFYIGESGETTYNRCYIDGIAYVYRDFERGEWCKYVDFKGRDVCAISVQDDGVLITKPEGDVYHMSNFANDEVVISKNGLQIGKIKVNDNVQKGIYEVRWTKINGEETRDDYVQTIVYDPLTGKLLSNHIDYQK